MTFFSPLRYPGGKHKLFSYIEKIVEANFPTLDYYMEPYAGGAAIALDLLMSNKVKKIYINDINLSIFSFWYSILNETQKFCDEIEKIEISIDEWQKQRLKQKNYKSLVELGVSTFYLNRTNVSGIIKGGVIGGINQRGKYKINARFNKERLICRIKNIAGYRDQINISNLDAIRFLRKKEKKVSKESTLIYLDPPYFRNGRKLYADYYKEDDHCKIMSFLKIFEYKWIISYDDVQEIRELYKGFHQEEYSINYSANNRYKGNEIMIFSPLLIPIPFKKKDFNPIGQTI